MELTEKEFVILKRFDKYCYKNGVSNALAFKIINTITDYTPIRTPAIFAQENNISPQAVYKYRTIKDTKIGKLVVRQHQPKKG